MCDCHLSWLVDFINGHSDIITVSDVDCIFNLGSDFSQCLGEFYIAACSRHRIFSFYSLSEDACELGYHPCNVEATCTIVNNTLPVCTCKPCFIGDGIDCSQRTCPSQNMVCQPSTGECRCGEDFSASSTGVDPCTRIGRNCLKNLSHCVSFSILQTST